MLGWHIHHNACGINLLFCSFGWDSTPIITDDFFGIAIRIGRETEIEDADGVYHITIQIGFRSKQNAPLRTLIPFAP